MGMDARKTPPQVGVQMSDTKSTADSTGAMSGPLVSPVVTQRFNFIDVILRLLCLLTSVTALSVMVSAKQASTIPMFGFNLPISSKWTFSNSFQYLVGVTATVALHSLLQLVHGISSIRQKSLVISQNYVWLLFAGDQILAYMLMSAGSAAAGVTNLNRTGIRHSALPNFCKPLHQFCDRVAVSITFTFISFLFLEAATVTDVIWLSKH